MRDLVLLVADKNTEAALREILQRTSALGIRAITFDTFVHPQRDPGCVNGAHLFLQSFANDYRHAMVVLDHEGSGREQLAPATLAAHLTQQLGQSGWQDRACAIVIAPELEVWVWNPSPHVAACIGWGHRQPDLRNWLASNGQWLENQPKPTRPKEALEAVLREIHRPRTSALYADLASRVSLRGHSEPAFATLTAALQTWFGAIE